ncbi:hypothetical protein [Bradyrhizobium sp.]|uniref:hypothetical protein n=1 Tax=Bradyrhizobium sp. TaxID=376 RepID=UPI003C3D6160
MGYAAIGLAILGFAVGAAFRFYALLPIIGLTLVSSVAFSFHGGFTFLETGLTIIVAQSILQGFYVLGLVARAAFDRTNANDPASGPPHPPPRR